MRLTTFKAQGFKSFVDPISFKVDGELTGVVGPNGCGKSNIADAIRWVLGESRASSLRGSTLADVMFNGSEKRQPVDWCHVELHFTNDCKNHIWAAYPEIIVRRELSRDGKQSYTINGMTVRRRDVVDLFRGTGVAPRAYGVIEQGTVADIADASPEELRTFMEEAAGISHYKERRRESERRLLSSKDNLAQLSLVLDGLQKRMDALKRQARTTRRYRALGEQINHLDALLILSRRGVTTDKLATIRQEMKTQEETTLQQKNQLNALKEKSDKKKEAQLTTQSQVDAALAELSDMQKMLTKTEQNIHNAMQGKDTAHTRLEEAKNELDKLQQQVGQFNEQEKTLKTQAQTAAQEITQNSDSAEKEAQALAQLHSARENAQANVDAAREQLTTTQRQMEMEMMRQQMLTQQLAEIKQRLKTAFDAYETLAPQQQIKEDTREQEQEITAVEKAQAQAQAQHNENTQSLEATDTLLRARENENAMLTAEIKTLNALLPENEYSKNAQRLAHILKINAGKWSRAVDAALGMYAAAVVTEKIDAALAAAQLPPAGTAVVEIAPEAPPADENRTGLPALLSLLDAPDSQSRTVLEYWLAGVYAAENDQLAAAARPRLSPQQIIVTPSGAVYGRHSLLITGKVSGGYDWEQRKNTLSAERQKKEAEIENLKARHADIKKAIQAQQEQVEQFTRRLQQQQSTLFDQRLEINRHVERQQALKAREAELKQLIHTLQEQQQSLSDNQAARAAAVRRLESAHQAQQEKFNQEKSNLDNANAALENYRIVTEESRLKRHNLERHLEELARQQEELTLRTRENSDRRQLLARQVEDFNNEIKKYDAEHMQQQLATYRQRFAAGEELVATRRRQRSDTENELAQLEEQREQIRHQLDAQQQKITEQRLQEHESVLYINSLNDSLEELALSPEQLKTLSDEASQGDGQWESKIDELRGQRDRLGSINFMAESELNEYEAKMSENQAQKDDIENAIKELRSAIRQIDEETTVRMQNMYESVNREFAQLYKRVFGGGEAYLEMSGDDILESGFELKVRPPGKRLFPVRMLSGGEKAASAVTFIFSILRLNPPPFCILDEVDAPLDDHRTQRFIELLQDISRTVQCLVITHNKNTISSIPRLIGVTQEELGASKVISVTVSDALRVAEA